MRKTEQDGRRNSALQNVDSGDGDGGGGGERAPVVPSAPYSSGDRTQSLGLSLILSAVARQDRHSHFSEPRSFRYVDGGVGDARETNMNIVVFLLNVLVVLVVSGGPAWKDVQRGGGLKVNTFCLSRQQAHLILIDLKRVGFEKFLVHANEQS